MKKKLLFVIAASVLSFGLIASIVPTSIALSQNQNFGSPKTLSSDITPTKPGRGEVVSFLPENVSKFWQMEDLLHNYVARSSEIGELMPYNDELASWASHMGSSESEKDIRRGLFSKYDAFLPTNNILAWDSKINAKAYKIVISQDKSFSIIEREYDVDGSKNSVIF